MITKGKNMPQKFSVVSDSVCYGHIPSEGEEIIQKFTINSRGQIWFSSRVFGEDFFNLKIGRKIRKSIEPKIAENILNDVLTYFNTRETIYVTDCGSYKLKIFFDDETEEYSAPLFYESQQLVDICNKIRMAVEIDNLYLFDGGYYGEDEDSEDE